MEKDERVRQTPVSEASLRVLIIFIILMDLTNTLQPNLSRELTLTGSVNNMEV